MTIGKDRNKDRFENWQLGSVWKVPFCGHRAIKPTQNSVSFTKPCINLVELCLPSLVNTTPRYLNLFTCCSVFPFTYRVHCLGFVDRHSTSIFLVLIFIPARSHAAKKTLECMLKTVEKTLAVPNRLQKVNGCSCSSLLWHPLSDIISEKTVAGFAVNAWRPFVIFYKQNKENGCLENYICVRAFKNRPVSTDQVFFTHCMLCLL